MNLGEKLYQLAKYQNRYTYEELVKRLEQIAKKGRYFINVYEYEVFESDIEKLKGEGVKAELIEDKTPNVEDNYWRIYWD